MVMSDWSENDLIFYRCPDIATCVTQMDQWNNFSPLAETLVVMRTFSLPSRKRWMIAARCSMVSSPVSKPTTCWSDVIFSANHDAVERFCWQNRCAHDHSAPYATGKWAINTQMVPTNIVIWKKDKSRVPDQNGISRLHNMLEKYHSGPKPSNGTN